MCLFAIVGGGRIYAANDQMYLRSNLKGGSWTENVEAYKFSKQWDGSQDVYTLTITSEMMSDLSSTDDIWFRLYRESTDYEVCPYVDNGSYTYTFSNGQNETYDISGITDKYKGTTYAFGLDQSAIGANEYKITVYMKYNTPWEYYIKAEIVSMPATVSALGYSTFSCNRALNLNNASAGLSAYKASVSENKVVLTKVTGKVAAGTGLLLAGTTGTIPVVPTAEGTDISGSNLLKASVEATEVAASTSGKYHYFLAGTSAEDIGFYNLAAAATSGAGKAYLETTTELTSAGSGARASWIFQDEEQETDGIQTAKAVTYNDNVYYDLQGRKVAYPTKGLYIINGKKVVVK